MVGPALLRTTIVCVVSVASVTLHRARRFTKVTSKPDQTLAAFLLPVNIMHNSDKGWPRAAVDVNVVVFIQY